MDVEYSVYGGVNGELLELRLLIGPIRFTIHPRLQQRCLPCIWAIEFCGYYC